MKKKIARLLIAFVLILSIGNVLINHEVPKKLFFRRAYEDDLYNDYTYEEDDYYDDVFYDDEYDEDDYGFFGRLWDQILDFVYGDELYDDEYGEYDNDDAYGDGYDEADYYDDYYSADGDEEAFAVYLVEDGDIQLESGTISEQDKETYEKMWNQAAALIPDDYETMISQYHVFSDGVDETMAYMENQDDGLVIWFLALDPADSIAKNGNFTRDFDETIIHEFGHLLTLNGSQMDNNAVNTYVAYEGRLKEKAYLNLFYQAFWADIMDEYKHTVDEESDEDVYAFYEAHEDMFVGDYAATNPEEDIAESFRVFVTGNRPKGDSIKDQKVLFFYGFDELVDMRDMMRSHLN